MLIRRPAILALLDQLGNITIFRRPRMLEQTDCVEFASTVAVSIVDARSSINKHGRHSVLYM